MPTPSSEQPSEPSSPVSHSFLSNCPDDLQDAAVSNWPLDGATNAQSSHIQRSNLDERSLATAAVTSDESAVGEERSSIEPSSRATTMSPRPHSFQTGGTSPASAVVDPDANKNTAVASGSASNSLVRSVTDPSQLDLDSPGRRSPDQSKGVHPKGVEALDAVSDDDLYAPSMGGDFSSMRTKPVSPSSFLRPGSRFHGTQQSEKQIYDVQVEIKHVDMRESFLCGYLRIQGLTEDHPTLTTYFEAEIIGPKYGFRTQHEDWGANLKVDLSHWSKFPAFRPFQKQLRRGQVTIHDVAQKDNIFMRWKEYFLVPDHRVRTISGASFEGFYYICFNQIKGEVSGMYFHTKSEKFQQLDLKHVPDRGCLSAVELR